MEAAAGIVAAQQIISTAVEGGAVAGVALAQSTQPLRATLTRIASSPDNDSPDSLQRSAHTATVLHSKAYIFGGITPGGHYATKDMHIIRLPDSNHANDKEYQCIPAIPTDESGGTPSAMAKHTACVIKDSIFFYGGTDESGGTIGDVWEFDTTTLTWTKGREHEAGGPIPPSRHSHNAVAHQDAMIIQGGLSAKGKTLDDAWVWYALFQRWVQIPTPPKPSQPSSLAVINDILYLLSHTATYIDTIHQLHLQVKDSVWQTVTLPPGSAHALPSSRTGSLTVPISTGYGRYYILQLFGMKRILDETSPTENEYLTDMWGLQLPSQEKTVTQAKDVARESLGFASGEYSWAEVDVQAKDQEVMSQGNNLPGSLAHYAISAVDGKTVLLWGGVDGNGKTVGDGWIIKIV